MATRSLSPFGAPKAKLITAGQGGASALSCLSIRGSGIARHRHAQQRQSRVRLVAAWLSGGTAPRSLERQRQSVALCGKAKAQRFDAWHVPANAKLSEAPFRNGTARESTATQRLCMVPHVNAVAECSLAQQWRSTAVHRCGKAAQVGAEATQGEAKQGHGRAR